MMTHPNDVEPPIVAGFIFLAAMAIAILGGLCQ